MFTLILLLTISRLGESSLPYHGVTVGLTPYSAPVNSQYHRQDVFGQYAYGYATPHVVKDEIKTADGVTRGGYSYIDANGILQSVQYISDPVNGFRVAATNIPRDLPEVAHAKAQHFAAYEQISAELALLHAKENGVIAISPLPVHDDVIVPISGVALPPVPTYIKETSVYAPAGVEGSSQFHAQNGHGQYTYGYADSLSSKSETKSADGTTKGGYSYIDANGVLQQVAYVSDPVNGFRVQATNLPQAPIVELIGPKVTTTVVGPKDINAEAAVTNTEVAPQLIPIAPVATAFNDPAQANHLPIQPLPAPISYVDQNQGPPVQIQQLPTGQGPIGGHHIPDNQAIENHFAVPPYPYNNPHPSSAFPALETPTPAHQPQQATYLSDNHFHQGQILLSQNPISVYPTASHISQDQASSYIYPEQERAAISQGPIQDNYNPNRYEQVRYNGGYPTQDASAYSAQSPNQQGSPYIQVSQPLPINNQPKGNQGDNARRAEEYSGIYYSQETKY